MIVPLKPSNDSIPLQDAYTHYRALTMYRNGDELSVSTYISALYLGGHYTIHLYGIDGNNSPERFPAFTSSIWLPPTIYDNTTAVNTDVISAVNVNTNSLGQLCVSCSIHSLGRGFITVYHLLGEVSTLQLHHVIVSRNHMAEQNICVSVPYGRYSVAVFGISGNDVGRIGTLPAKSDIYAIEGLDQSKLINF